MKTILSFVMLSWNSDKTLQGVLDSIIRKCESEKLGFEIIVVDNGSSDDSVDIIKRIAEKEPDYIRPIFLNRNFGTTIPRNMALKYARGQYLCVIDSDAEIRGGSIRKILRLIDVDNIGLIAPRLVLSDGTVQNSVKKFPTMINKLMKIPHIMLGFKLGDVDFYPDFPFFGSQNVDTAISACWFLKKKTIDIVGMLDENIFYSPEDIDYCIRIWKKGLRIVYCTDLTVLHITQQISHRSPLSKVSLSHFGGLIYYFRKHGGWISNRKIHKQIQAFSHCG